MAQSTINISLPEELKKKASERVVEARYSNVSDYIRDLIRNDVKQHDVEAQLAELIREGIESGVSKKNQQDFIANLRTTLTSKKHG